MKQHCSIVFLILFIGFYHISWAQQRGTGLMIDDGMYQKCPQISNQWTGAKYERLPLSINLRPYCPTPGQQGTQPTCVGWAVGYGGLTICRAVQSQLTHRSQIDALAHSAYYVYNNVKTASGCQLGAALPPALAFLQQKGDCRAATFGNDTTLCDARPDSRADEEAALFKIKDYARLFDVNETAAEKTKTVRQALKDSSPVVIGLYLTRSFYNVADGQKLWSPAADEAPLEAHALVVVGYDMATQTFDLMNSWGEYWGDGGFIKINFEDFTRLTFYAFRMIPDIKTPIKTTTVFKNEDVLTGELVLNTVNNGQFETVKTVFNAQRQVYETVRKDWKANEALFQFRARGVPQGQYVYIFSTDALNKTEIHYPLSTDTRAKFSPSQEAEMVLPAENDALIKSTIGEDILYILYANYPLVDFEKRVKKVAYSKGTATERLKAGFSDFFTKNNRIHYDSDKMRFESRATQGNIVPIILAINAQ
jgi:Papain family cysteine protease